VAIAPASDVKPGKVSKSDSKPKSNHKPRRESGRHEPLAPAAQEPKQPASGLPVADGLAGTTKDLLAPVTDTVDQALDQVDSVVDDVGGTLEPVTSGLPPLP
jgi:hypothetical protein